MRQPSIDIDICNDLAIIQKQGNEYELGLDEHEVEAWARYHMSDYVTIEKDPDDGLPISYIDKDVFRDVAKEFVRSKEELWKLVTE